MEKAGREKKIKPDEVRESATYAKAKSESRAQETSAPKDTQGCVPRLRFSEFIPSDHWLRVPGNELFDPIVNKDHNSDLPILAISQEYGAIPREEIDYNVVVTDRSIESYKVVEVGDFIISLRSFQGGIEYSEYRGICSPAYIILRKNNNSIDNLFFKYYFKTDAFINALNRNIEGIRDGKMVSYAQFSELKLPFPEINEQQKIAACLSSIDELIDAHARKLEALKKYKKGLMQRLFPAEGESVPRLRFAEFEDIGEWKEATLGKIVDFVSGSTPSKVNPIYWHGSIPWVSAKDMKKKYLSETEDHITAVAVEDGAKLIPVGTILILTRGMTLLKDIPICIVNRSMCFNQDVKALIQKGETSSLFLAQLLSASKSRILCMVDIAGHGTGRLDTDELMSLSLMIPKAAEQQKIAACLSSLDDLISAQAAKVEELKQHKRGLMQGLFPGPEEES